MKTKKLLSLLFLFFIFSIKLAAQREGNFWYFGGYAGIDFNSGTSVAVTDGQLNTGEGCATISDATGHLLFYTDGITVWNKTHTVMPNGTGLLGHWSSTQSAIIIPKPGSTTIYYIFTTDYEDHPQGLCYSEVDMTLDGGLGDITAIKNIRLYEHVSEKLTAVKNADGLGIWVIAHVFTTNQFLAFPVTGWGVIATPIISSTGMIDYGSQGYLKSSADGSKLAAAFTANDSVQVFDFNTVTGAVYADFSFRLTGAYGVEFSPNGKRLYVTRGWIGANDVDQYNMDFSTADSIIASGTIIGRTASPGFGALQNAPDKKMYVARWGYLYADDPDGAYIACITYPDSLGLACGFVDSALYLLGKKSIFGLPNYITSFFYSSPFKYTNQCKGDTTFFSLTDSIYLDSIRWNFGDAASGINNSSASYSSYHLYSDTGSYTVSVIKYIESIADTSVSIVHIFAPPVVFIGNDTSYCGTAGVQILDGGDGGYAYLWQDSSTFRTFRTTTGGIYYVGVTNGCGTTYDTIHINAIPYPDIHANSSTICMGDTAALIVTGGTTYSWSTGDTTAGINVNPIITETYTVIGSNEEGCSDTTTATVNVNPLPIISTTGDVTIVAGSQTFLQAGGGISYNWSPSYALNCTACPSTNASPLRTTAYCVLVSNGNCSDSSCITVTVEMPCPDFTGLQLPDAFSPNNDGNNDNFLLQGWNGCITGFSIDIYDRWGEKVYESTNVNFTWDGIYKNKALDPGVFVYYINAQLIGGTNIKRKGNITLIK